MSRGRMTFGFGPHGPLSPPLEGPTQPGARRARNQATEKYIAEIEDEMREEEERKKKLQEMQAQIQRQTHRSPQTHPSLAALDRDRISSNTQLSREDALRFKATLEESLERLDVVGLITADSLRRRKDPQQQQQQIARTRKDVHALMRHERELESQYETLMSERSSLRGLSNKSKYQQHQQELTKLTQQLKNSQIEIFNNLKDHPTLVGNLQKVQKDRYALCLLFNHVIGELVNSNTFDSLIENVNQRAEESKLLQESKLRHEKTQETLKKLYSQLEDEWRTYERAEETKNHTISQLTARLKHLKKVTMHTVKFEQQSALAKAESESERKTDALEKQQQEIAKIRAAYKQDKRVHKRTLAFLQKQKDEMDMLHNQWEQKYEEDHTTKTVELEKLNEARATDLQSLVSQQKRWEEEKATKLFLLQEAKERAEEEKAYKELQDRMYLAACAIQFAWRVYWRRRKKDLKKLKKKYMAKLRAQKKAEAKGGSMAMSSSRKK